MKSGGNPGLDLLKQSNSTNMNGDAAAKGEARDDSKS